MVIFGSVSEEVIAYKNSGHHGSLVVQTGLN